MERQKLKVLVIEDSPGDVELLRGLLEDAGYDAFCRQVDDFDALRGALGAGESDLIICDYTLPGFNGLEALNLYNEYDLDTPFIIVSGTIGEESAVHAMKAGAHDYILKDNMARLVPAIRRELAEARSRGLRKRAERELKASEEKFRTMAESIPQIIWTSDAGGNIDYWNRRWLDYSGLDEDADLGRSWEETLHPEDKPTILKAWRQALKSGVGFQNECRFKRAADGKYLWHLWRAHAVRDENGKIVKWFGSFTDIDEHKNAEVELRKWEEIFNHAGWGVAMIHPETGVLQAVNPAFAAMHGYTESQMLGMSFDIVLAPEARAAFPERLREIAVAGHHLYEAAHRRCNGQVFTVLTDITVVKDRDGKPSYHAANFQDITAQKNAEKAMRDTNQRLMRLNQMRSEFTSMISHELKTPLTVIKEGVHIVLEEMEGPLSSGQHETLEMTSRNIDRLSHLIHTVLSFEKIESGCWGTSFRAIDLSALTAELCELMKMACRKKGISLSCELPEGGVQAVCDADKIRQVLLNLIDNAVKFTVENGSIEVRLRQGDGQAVLEVRDDGIGIKKEDQEKIFKMFSQSLNEYSWRSHVTGGVGLAVCKKIMEEHHGRIGVESRPGQGTCFTVEFPLSQPAGAESAA